MVLGCVTECGGSDFLCFIVNPALFLQNHSSTNLLSANILTFRKSATLKWVSQGGTI